MNEQRRPFFDAPGLAACVFAATSIWAFLWNTEEWLLLGCVLCAVACGCVISMWRTSRAMVIGKILISLLVAIALVERVLVIRVIGRR